MVCGEQSNREMKGRGFFSRLTTSNVGENVEPLLWPRSKQGSDTFASFFAATHNRVARPGVFKDGFWVMTLSVYRRLRKANSCHRSCAGGFVCL